MMFTLLQLLNLIFKRITRELHHTHFSKIKNFLAKNFNNDVAKKVKNLFFFSNITRLNI